MYVCRSPSACVYSRDTLSQADNSSVSSAWVIRRHELPPKPATCAIRSSRSPHISSTGSGSPPSPALAEPPPPLAEFAGAPAEHAAMARIGSRARVGYFNLRTETVIVALIWVRRQLCLTDASSEQDRRSPA